MYGYIYLTTNIINNKKYIGQHKSNKFTQSYKGSGIYLREALNKYGKDNFNVVLLEECNSQEELNERECYYISLYNAVESDEFYNLCPGGQYDGPRYGSIPWNKGLTKETDERVNKYVNTKKEKFVSGEAIGFCGRKGSNNPNYVDISNNVEFAELLMEYWQTHCDTNCMKKFNLSKSMFNRYKNEFNFVDSEERQKRVQEGLKQQRSMAATKREKNKPKKYYYYCEELDIYFDSLIEASRYFGFNKCCSNIKRASLNGGKAYGYHWKEILRDNM